MRWTLEQLAEYKSRRAQWDHADDTPDPGPESRLAAKISLWARGHGYPILNLRQSRKAKGFLPPGWPDVTLVLPGNTVFLELKSKTGRKSPEQIKMAQQFKYLKQPIHEVRSYKRFIEIVETPSQSAQDGPGSTIGLER